MPMNMLQIVQEVRGRLGQPIPASVAGNLDAGIIQMQGMLNEFVEDLETRQYWQANEIEATWITTATESQGPTATLFPYGFCGIVPDTFFNRTTRLSVVGGIGSAEWSARKASSFSGPLPTFRIRNNELLLIPAPAAAQTYAVEYYSNFFVKNDADPRIVYRQYWLKDTDYCTVSDTLAIAYLKWAWKSAKGLDYAEDFRKYERLVSTKAVREKTALPLSMSGCAETAMGPGVLVSPGSWPVSN